MWQLWKTNEEESEEKDYKESEEESEEEVTPLSPTFFSECFLRIASGPNYGTSNGVWQAILEVSDDNDRALSNAV